MQKLTIILVSIFFLGFGIFLGMFFCVKFGIYDKYTQDLIQSETGKRFYTSQECVYLYEHNKLNIPINNDHKFKAPSLNNNIKQDKHAKDTRNQLQKIVQ